MQDFNAILSRAVAGASSFFNFGLGGAKVLGGLFGAAIAPATGPPAPATEVISDYESWSGFWQATSGVEQFMYAATGNQQYQQESQQDITFGTLSGFLTYAATGNLTLSSSVGGLENMVPADAVLDLVDAAEQLSDVNPCQ